MSCTEWEKRIALTVEGDLAPAEVAPHLAACPACRHFAAELRDSQLAFKSWHEETVDPALLDRIRGRVMARLSAQAPPRRTWAWWWWAPAAAALCAFLVLAFWTRPTAAPAPPRLAFTSPPPLPVTPSAPPRLAASPRRRVAASAMRSMAAAAGPLLMKIQTDDPNVVIYWIVESKQKGD